MQKMQDDAALLVVDMINDFQFEGADDLLPKMDALTRTILRLRDDADRLRVPTIYVNDNYGQWHSDRGRIVQSCLTLDNPGREFVQRMAPREQDDFVIKPQMSGFYSTNLQVMLPRLGISRLALVGIQADICILFTAADAHMRDYDLWVPGDAVASEDDQRRDWALQMIRQTMQGRAEPTATLGMQRWLARRPCPRSRPRGQLPEKASRARGQGRRDRSRYWCGHQVYRDASDGVRSRCGSWRPHRRRHRRLCGHGFRTQLIGALATGTTASAVICRPAWK